MYLEQKRITTELIKSAQTTFYIQKVLECGKDLKALFKVIDSLQGRNKVSILPAFDSPMDVAEEFSELFFKKIVDIRDKLDKTDETPDQLLHVKTVLSQAEVELPNRL